MAYNSRHARTLLSASELPLFESSVGDALTGWSAAQLRQKIKRACTLRDKYRDLLRRQKLSTRARTGAKSGVHGDANARTEQKAKLFEEVQQRLAHQQAKLAAAEARKQASATLAATGQKKVVAAKRLSSKRKAAGPTTANLKETASFVSEKAITAARRSQLAGARSKVIQTHLAAQGRRRQAARDKR